MKRLVNVVTMPYEYHVYICGYHASRVTKSSSHSVTATPSSSLPRFHIYTILFIQSLMCCSCSQFPFGGRGAPMPRHGCKRHELIRKGRQAQKCADTEQSFSSSPNSSIWPLSKENLVDAMIELCSCGFREWKLQEYEEVRLYGTITGKKNASCTFSGTIVVTT